jgi:tryptophan-rich sensory protein
VHPVPALIGFLVVCFAVAVFGSLFQPGPWYAALTKPSWTPPNWIFAPVWAVLYVMIANAGWLVWRTTGFKGAALAFVLYALQLVLNALWSWLFFGHHRLDLSFFDIIALWIATLSTLIAFYAVRPVAGLLLLPYLLWISFAVILNFYFWRLNSPGN